MNDALLIAATIAGPILAVQAQKWIERATEHNRRRQWIFETLMATRATRLDPAHVRALNQIELDFGGSHVFGFQRNPTIEDRKVIDKWREYADLLNEQTPDGDEAALKDWTKRADDSFITLLEVMAIAMGRHYDRVQLRRGIYYPRGFSDAERKQQFMQDALGRVLVGAQTLAMEVRSFPQPTDEAVSLQTQLQTRIIKAISEDGVLHVEITNQKDPKPKSTDGVNS